MNDSLMINNMYAAYSATARQSEKNISEMREILKNRELNSDREEKQTAPSISMDKLIISNEALELLKEMALA